MKELHGFKLIEKEHFDEINGEVYLFEHIKSGAKLIYILNDDINRVFMIGFRTPSDNSTGVAHILEHSTLCGSEKYPVKEPFVELLKGSLNTFLNAMTYPDKTVYPVASTNKKDFRNLTDVYLDAVFNPNIYNDPYTFKQEGWHYHLEEKDQPIEYNGVVYNEMKGVYSDPNAVMERGILESLYPNTIYSQESGGNPNDIVNLTYEEFLNFHSKYYHPSNSYIYLYGDNDLEDDLKYLNSWLDKYDKKIIDAEIKSQEKFDSIKTKEIPYSINPNDSIENKDMISLNFSFDDNLSPLEIRSLNILIDYLLDNNSSLLKKTLLEKHLAADVNAFFETSLKQPFLSIILKDTDVSKSDEFINTVNKVLKDLVKNGINKDDLEAVINSNEFRTLESLNGEGIYYPKGLIIGLLIFEYWLYGKNPFDSLKIFNQFEKIKELKENNYFEDLIKKYLLENTHKSIVYLKPDKDLLKQQQDKLQTKLNDYKKSLSQKELDSLVEETVSLINHQNREDSAEALNTIPRLKIEEIERKVIPINYDVINNDKFPIIYVNNEKGNIVYIDLYFDFHAIKQEDIKYLKLLEEVLSEVNTQNYSYEILSKELDKYTGGLETALIIHSDIETKKAIPHFVIRIATKEENLSKTINLLAEIINKSVFTQKKVIKDIIQSIRIQKKSTIQNNGNYIAGIRMNSTLSEPARILEEVDGISYYDFIVDLDENFEDKWNKISETLTRLSKELFNINSLVIAFACNQSAEEEVLNELYKLGDTLENNKLIKQNYSFKELPTKQAFITPGNVMYNVKGGSYDFSSEDNIGSLRVLRTLLAMDYLWNKVRVLGGAYGVNFNFNRLGEFSFSSYRDPNLDNTYKNYDESVEYIKNLDLNQNDIDKYIIGTISSLDTPLSTKKELSSAASMFFSGLTNEKRQIERDQILNTKLDDLIKNADIIDKILKQNNYTTVGTEQALDNNQTRFEDIEFIK